MAAFNNGDGGKLHSGGKLNAFRGHGVLCYGGSATFHTSGMVEFNFRHPVGQTCYLRCHFSDALLFGQPCFQLGRARLRRCRGVFGAFSGLFRLALRRFRPVGPNFCKIGLSGGFRSALSRLRRAFSGGGRMASASAVARSTASVTTCGVSMPVATSRTACSTSAAIPSMYSLSFATACCAATACPAARLASAALASAACAAFWAARAEPAA